MKFILPALFALFLLLLVLAPLWVRALQRAIDARIEESLRESADEHTEL